MSNINIPFGGWGINPATGQTQRYWGGGVFTGGEDPTGGAGPNWYQSQQGTPQAQAPQTQAPQITSNTTSSDLINQYLGQLGSAQSQYNDILNQYLSSAQENAGLGQRILDEVKGAGMFPSASQYRQEYASNENLTPMALEALASQRVNTTRGTIGDLINRLTGSAQAQTAGLNTAAGLAQNNINNILQSYGLASQAIQPQNQQLQFMNLGGTGYAVDPVTGEIVNTYGGGGSGSGGGKSLYDIAAEIEAGFGTANPEPTPQPQPNTTPQSYSPYQDYFNTNFA